MTKKLTLIRLLAIHQNILQQQWVEEITQSTNIQPVDIYILRKERSQLSTQEIHHMIYRELGGSSKQRNEVSLPHHIHRRIHREFPDMLPHEMIANTINPEIKNQKTQTIYKSFIWPDLGITPHSRINPIVAKYLQNTK